MTTYATCNKCGEHNLVWHQTKQSKWILVNPVQQNYENGVGYWVEPHKCDKIQAIKNANIAILEKRIENTIRICAEQNVSEEMTNLLVAEIENKIAIERGWS